MVLGKLSVPGRPINLDKSRARGSRVRRWYLVNFQCRGVRLIWIKVGQGVVGCCDGIWEP